ncbi:MAG: LuxR C-terminal-related transcriptional regulator [Candidatus Binatia bacterium]
MILIASNTPKLAMRWTRALRGKNATCLVNQKTALEESLSGLKPHVLLFDIGLSRLRVARELPTLQGLSPATKIIVISDSCSPGEALAVLKAGAKGYCSHDISCVLLQKAIRAVLRGELWAGRQIISELIAEMISPGNRRILPREDTRLDGLTARRQQVAALILDGAGNKEIANRLSITEATVKAHVTGLFRQFNVGKRLELARLLTPMQPDNGISLLPPSEDIPSLNRR